MEAIVVNSKPLFSTSPMFCHIVEYPEVAGTGTCRSKSLVFLM